MGAVRGVAPSEALSNAWYFGALFHDVGRVIEGTQVVLERLANLRGPVVGYVQAIGAGAHVTRSALERDGKELFHEFPDGLRASLTSAFARSLDVGRPDHGVVSALRLRQVGGKPGIACCAREGARAACLHNVVGGLGSGTDELSFGWSDEPLACLLLLCDQLQTWDRERGDETGLDDYPSRAELTEVTVEEIEGRVTLRIAIDYIAPRHLARAPVLYARVRSGMLELLRHHPDRVLTRIKQEWPFAVQVRCSLSGDPLEPTMSFG